MKLVLFGLVSAVSRSSAFVLRPQSIVRPQVVALRAANEVEEESSPNPDFPPSLEVEAVPVPTSSAVTPVKTAESKGLDLSFLSDLDIGAITKSIDLSALKLDDVLANLGEGELGSRGETYFLAKVAVLLCILGGGIPVVGDILMLLLGPGLLALGLGAILVAVPALGSNLSPWPVPPSGGKLVTDGIYGKIRHPLYAGLLAGSAGLSIVSGSAIRLLLTVVLLYVTDVGVEFEEEELIKKYGASYEEYMKETPGRYFPQDILDEMPWNKLDGEE